MGHVASMRELSMPKRIEWIERMFARFAAYYGARFHDMWGGQRLDDVLAIWADELADFTPEEVTRGVAAARQAKFPPTLPEFIAMCRPGLDAEAAFGEAVQQMALRDQGRDRWSHPAIYWAAVTVGAFDLRNASWSAIKVRWARVLQAELAKGEWPPVPPRLDALPAPGQGMPDPARVEAAVRRVSDKVREVGDKQWALDYEARAQAGERLALWQYQAAESVLGRPLPRPSKAHRPDHADRAAGDDSFDERDAVPL